jgi:hypothetical protein
MADPIRRRSSRLIWLAVGAVVALAWGELYTSVMTPQNVDTVLDILQPDPVVGYTYKPDTQIDERGRGYDVPFDINGHGLRDREIGPKEDGVYRILLMGNSFSVSHGVAIEESFSRAVEDALNERRGELADHERVEVINGANAAYTVYNYWKGYTRWAEEFDLDAVLVGFVSGREHRCDPEGTRYVVRDGLVVGRFAEGEAVKLPRRDPIRRIRKFLARNSNEYVLLRNFLYYNDLVDRYLRGGDDSAGAARALAPYRQPPPEGVTAGWQRAYSHLASLSEEVAADGAELMVVAIPQIIEVDAQRLADLRQQAGLQADDVDPLQPTRSLRAFCEQAGITLLDPRSAVAAAHAQAPAYLLDDHWNARGIAAAAEAVAEQWRQSGRPPFSAIELSGTPAPTR